MPEADDTESKPSPERAGIVSKIRARYKQIGARLKSARKSAKAGSLEKLGAELFHVPKATMGHWETGRSAIGAAELGLLAERYGVSCDELILGKQTGGLSDEDLWFLRLMAQLGPEDRNLVIEYAEDRLRRAGGRPQPRKTARTGTA